MTEIWFIRHGETDWNRQRRLQGWQDIPLNEFGVNQASLLAARMRAEARSTPIHAIYSSDLQRAHDTAAAIAAATGAPLTTHTGLRERGFGLFEGRTYAEIEQRWPEESARWRKREPAWAPQGGESLLQVRERLTRTLHELVARHPGQQVALVAHGGVMDQLYRLATGQDLQAPRTWALGNTAVNRLLWTAQGLSLVGWADTSHLEDDSLDETCA